MGDSCASLLVRVFLIKTLGKEHNTKCYLQVNQVNNEEVLQWTRIVFDCKKDMGSEIKIHIIFYTRILFLTAPKLFFHRKIKERKIPF